MCDGLLQDGERQAGQLEVELIAGDPFAGAAELEVHVAEEVLGADDVEQHLVATSSCRRRRTR